MLGEKVACAAISLHFVHAVIHTSAALHTPLAAAGISVVEFVSSGRALQFESNLDMGR